MKDSFPCGIATEILNDLLRYPGSPMATFSLAFRMYENATHTIINLKIGEDGMPWFGYARARLNYIPGAQSQEGGWGL